MLGTVDTWITNLTDWLPSGLQPWAQLLIYFAILAVMSVIPLALWAAYVLRATSGRAARR